MPSAVALAVQELLTGATLASVVERLCEQDTSANTAIARKGASLPARKVAGKVKDGTKVLDYGCGRGQDLKFFKKKGASTAGYDPNHKPEKPDGKYEVVTLFYVLNVIEDKGERASAVKKAAGYLQDGGALYVAARSKSAIDAQAGEWKKSGDGYKTGSGTFQHGMTQEELVDLLDSAGLKASGWDLGTGDSVGAVGRKQGKNEAAIEALLQGAPLQEVFGGLLQPQALWEGIFGGVNAAEVLDRLVDLAHWPKGIKYKPLALALWRAIWKNDPGARSEARSQARKFEHEPPMDWWPNYMATFNQDLQSILKWPDPFWDALHQVAQAPMYLGQLGGDQMAVAAGVDPRVTVEVMDLASLAGHTPKTGYSKVPVVQKRYLKDLAVIGNVIGRFPEKLAQAIRTRVVFAVEGCSYKDKLDRPDSVPTEEQWDEIYQTPAKNQWGFRLLGDAVRYHHEGSAGYFTPHGTASGDLVWLSAPVDPIVVAHELGHFVWKLVYDPAHIKRFFEYLANQDVSAAKDTGDLFQRIKQTFLGLKDREALQALEDVEHAWSHFEGGTYIQTRAQTNIGPGMKKALAKAAGTIAEKIVSENEKLLGSWNEVWAEGFSRIISGKAHHVQVPGIMLSLIEYLLRRA